MTVHGRWTLCPTDPGLTVSAHAYVPNRFGTVLLHVCVTVGEISVFTSGGHCLKAMADDVQVVSPWRWGSVVGVAVDLLRVCGGCGC